MRQEDISYSVVEVDTSTRSIKEIKFQCKREKVLKIERTLIEIREKLKKRISEIPIEFNCSYFDNLIKIHIGENNESTAPIIKISYDDSYISIYPIEKGGLYTHYINNYNFNGYKLRYIWEVLSEIISEQFSTSYKNAYYNKKTGCIHIKNGCCTIL